MSQTQIGGSSSHQPMSLVSAFPNEELYEPQFSESYYQNTQREESPAEFSAPTPAPVTAKPRRRQKQKRGLKPTS